MSLRRTVPTVLVLATAALTGVAGCGALDGMAAPAAGAASAHPAGAASTGSAPADSDSAGSNSAGSNSARSDSEGAGSGSGSDSSGTAAKTSHSSKPTASHKPKPHGPRVVSFTVAQKPKCAEGTAVFRAAAVPLIIKWRITGADSAALSVDDPTGTPGTYGPVALSGTSEFTFSCAGPVGSTEAHTYAIYTVGGGTQKHRTLTVSAKVLDKDKLAS